MRALPLSPESSDSPSWISLIQGASHLAPPAIESSDIQETGAAQSAFRGETERALVGVVIDATPAETRSHSPLW